MCAQTIADFCYSRRRHDEVKIIILSAVLSGFIVLTWFADGVRANRQCSTYSDDFYFNVQPKGITVREGGRAFLECNVSNHCNIQFHWALDEETIQNTTRRYQNGSNLIITRVNRTLDSGEFHCIATLATTMVSRMSQPATLGILWINEENANVSLISPSLDELNAGKAKDLQLKCAVDGSSELEFRWLRNGRRLRKSDHHVIKGRKLTLLEPNAAADNGVYSCEASNAAGEVNSSSNFVLSIPDPKLPKIIVVPQQEILANLGDRVVFNCRFDSRATAVQWRKVDSNESFASTGRISVLSNHSLAVASVQPEDEGYFECVAVGREKDGAEQSYSGRLRIAYIGDFSEAVSFEPSSETGKYVVGLGKSFELACVPPRGHPTPTAFWTRRGEVVANVGRVRATSDLVLTIDPADKSDVGEYECVAHNMAGRRSARIDVSASRLPLIKQHPPSLNVEETETAVLACEHEGNSFPLTRIVWEKDGKPLVLAPGNRRIHVDEEFGKLVINDTRPSDRGQYVCVVRTAAQDPVKSLPGTVKIREKLKFVPAEPSSRKLEFGSDAQVHCRAAGEIIPHITWIKTAEIFLNGTIKEFVKPLTAFPEPDRIRDRNGTLYFHKVQFEDAGIYTCVATSSQGFIRANVRIDVAVFPHFTVLPENATVLETDVVWLHCQAQGTPTPTVQWDRESLQQSSWALDYDLRNRYFVYPNHTLMIRNVTAKDAGKFACTAGNRASLTRKEAIICVKAKEAAYCYCGRDVGFLPQCGLLPKIGTSGGGSNLPTNTIAIACGAAAGYIILVAILLAYCRYRRKRASSKEAQATNGNALSATGNGHIGMDPASVPLLIMQSNNGAEPFQNVLKDLDEFHYGLKLTDIPVRLPDSGETAFRNYIGWGEFGDVVVMKVDSSSRLPSEDKDNFVIVEELREGNSSEDRFFSKMLMCTKLSNPNIISTKGVCIRERPLRLVLEYPELGFLKKHLQSQCVSNGATHSSDSLSLPELLNLALQIAKGMQYMISSKFVHGDLALRNIMLAKKYVADHQKGGTIELQAKITFLSLTSGGCFSNEYVCFAERDGRKRGTFPLRWMAPETYVNSCLSEKSDVWAYAVTVWELLTFGRSLPYDGDSDETIVEKLLAGGASLSLKFPRRLSPAVKNLLSDCCLSPDASQRPTFREIVDTLKQYSSL